ncbi:CIA30 family protein [Maribius pontilimi]|uniref:CIA30 family protein n=2 Tax=Palleronia pontilimi TaxID=1964209 RepID=A0A934IGA2_9RHOB|nr:CIA30 family protein [Palleronia pontilimi]
MQDPLIDAVTGPETALGTVWELVSDQVMGGVSSGTLVTEDVAGRPARHLTGQVSLENNGGFLQMALDLDPAAGAVDASGFSGIELTVRGNGADYNIHLRTDDIARPWQSYRLTFPTTADWTTHRLPFAKVEAHRLEVPFDPATLRRIGLVAIGEAMDADLALARIAFY